MKTLLAGLGTAALGVAVLFTLLLALTTELFTLRPPGGPDSMGLFVVFLFPAAAWLLVLFGALVCVGRGGFDWVSRSPGIPTLAVLGSVVGLGILSVAAAVYSLEVRMPLRTPAGLAGGLLLPLFVIGLIGFLLWTKPAVVAASRWLRPTGAVLASLASLTFCGCFVAFVMSSVEDARRAEEGRIADEARQAETRAEDAKREKAQDAELAALPDDAPIEVFLTHLFIDKSEAHQRKAVERIRALPDLTARLEARLEHPEPLQREYVLNFVKMSGTPDPSWEPAVRKSIVRLAADYRAEAKDLSLGKITHVKGLAWGTLLAAQTFGPRRFEAEVRELRQAVATWPNEDPRNDALGVIDLYLEGKPVPE